MLRLDCDRCSREIIGDDVDVEGIRVLIAKASKNADEEFLYIMSGDDDGEPTGKHYCSACVAALLKGAASIIPSVPIIPSVAGGAAEPDEGEEGEEGEAPGAKE